MPTTTLNGKKTKTYNSWAAMRGRCYRKTAKNYKYYGARGIRVCDRWMERRAGFSNFVADLGEAPPGLWLERKDNAGDYTPDNCCWATPKAQASNRRSGGPPINPNSLRQRCIRAGMDYNLVFNRLRYGWKLERALGEPKNVYVPVGERIPLPKRTQSA